MLTAPAQDPEPTFFEKARCALTYYFMTVIPGKSSWDEIIDGLFLGSMPMQSCVWSSRNDGEALIKECEEKERPLKLVVSANDQWELEGKGTPGYKPVPHSYWAEKGVEHIRLPFKDFGANIPISDIKKIVDKIVEVIKGGGSVDVHCKAGRGRSLAIVLCTLIELGYSPNEAFAQTISKRAHVGPSISQFKLAEEYRAHYKPGITPLKLDDSIFTPYRKDFKGYISSPTLHAFLTTIGIILTWEVSLPAMAVASFGGVTVAALSSGAQNNNLNVKIRQYALLNADKLRVDGFVALEEGHHVPIPKPLLITWEGQINDPRNRALLTGPETDQARIVDITDQEEEKQKVDGLEKALDKMSL